MIFNISATDVKGVKHVLKTPILCEINSSFDAPADSLRLSVPCSQILPELTEISVCANGKEVFRGLVDEQTTGNANGRTLEISARSFACLLLDNEALPATYRSPSLSDIFSLHAKPYGFKGFEGAGALSGDFEVKKGLSEWEVIETFCKCAMNTLPYVSSDLVLHCDGVKKDEFVFSNKRAGAIKYCDARLKIRRYGEVSEINYKLAAERGYEYVYKNDDAENRSIRRRRFLNLSSTNGNLNEYRIKNAVSKSKREGFSIVLKVPDVCVAGTFSPAKFEDDFLGEYDGLVIAQTDFSLSRRGVYTLVTLRKKESIF